MNLSPPDPWVILGRFGAPVGLDGKIRFRPEAEFLEILEAEVPLFLWSGRSEPEVRLFLVEARSERKSWLVAWEGIEDRESAGKLRNLWLTARRGDLPPPPENKVYWSDLLGARVETKEGSPLGKVEDVLEAPASTVLEVGLGDGMRFLLPLTPEVDAEFEAAVQDGQEGRLLVRLPEGLVEATSFSPGDQGPGRRKRRRRGGAGPNTTSGGTDAPC